MIGNSTKVLVPLGTMAVAVAVTVGSGATWTSSTSINSSVKAGSIITTNSRGGLTLDISRMEPGETQTGAVQIANTGDMNAKLVLSQSAGATNAFSTPANLTLAISEGAVSIWSGTFGAMTTPTDLDADFTPLETHTYTFTVTLSASTPDIDQGKAGRVGLRTSRAPPSPGRTRSTAGADRPRWRRRPADGSEGVSGVEIATRRRRSRRPMRVVSTLLSVFATLVAVAFILPSFFGLQRYVITGTSMTGTIGFGSIAFEEVVPVGDLRVGDVITYAPPPSPGSRPHGDPPDRGDPRRDVPHQGGRRPAGRPLDLPARRSRAVARRVLVPWVGYPFIWLADRETRMLVIGGPAAVIALISLGQVLDSLRRRPGDRGRTPGHRRTSVSVGG